MANIYEEFVSLLNIAAAKDKHVKSVKSKYKFKEYQGDELIRKINEFWNNLAAEYKKNGITQDSISPESRDLLKFISRVQKLHNMTGGSSSGGMGMSPGPIDSSVTECKPPMSAGGLTFDDIAGQHQVKEDIRQNYIYPFTLPGLYPTKSKGIMFYGPPGTGKCLAPDEKVIMFDGTMKEAQYIVQGDLLMGDDSTSRLVHGVCSGEDEMYRVVPDNGESFVVNEPHILTLVNCISKNTIDIPLNEYLKKSDLWKSQHKGYRIGVEWSENSNLPIDPYILGVWLGDGFFPYPQLQCADTEVYNDVNARLKRIGLKMILSEENPIAHNIIKDTSDKNSFIWGLDDLGLLSRVHIPQRYITNSKRVRLQVLAGLIDSDGRRDHGKYEFLHQNKSFADEIVFLARSCGYYVTIVKDICFAKCEEDVCYKIVISGDIHNIPVRSRKRKVSIQKQSDVNGFSFTVEPLGKGKYCGFTIDGNRRFLLKDFTVTHNTLLARAATAEIPGAAFFAPTPGTLKGKYVGETEKNIEAVFKCAAEIIGKPIPGGPQKGVSNYRVAIIFIDEFDTLAGSRSDDPHMANSVNALLQAMDGIESSPNVSVIAATNLPWNIDDAVLRRFSARIFVDLPDKSAREWLIRDAIAKVFLSPEQKERVILQDEEIAEARRNGVKITPKKIVPQVMSKKFSKKTQKMVDVFHDNIFSSIKKYGKSLCPTVEEDITEAAGSMFSLTRPETKTKTVSKIVTPDFVGEISEDNIDRKKKLADHHGMLGINTKSKDLVKRIIQGEKIDYDAEDITDSNKDYFFGYSGSDISKIMDISIQIASSRALDSAFSRVDVTIDGKTYSYYVASSEFEEGSDYVVTEYAKLKLSTSHDNKQTPYILLQGDDLLRVVNYSLCQTDILNGIKKYPSTIKTKTYVDLLIYKYQGLSPEK